MFESKLKKNLKLILKDPSVAATVISEISGESVESAAEAELVVQVLKLFPLAQDTKEAFSVSTPLHETAAWMQNVENDKAISVFKKFGGPELVRIFDEVVEAADSIEEDDTYQTASDLMFLLKVICMYAPEGGVLRFCRSARSPLLSDGYLWSVIFDIIANEGHPWQEVLLEALRDPLPDEFACVAYLDFANAAARAGWAKSHPFDSEKGIARLQEWLSDENEECYTYAHSAAASIPFLSEDAGFLIQASAERHPSKNVQLEAAWAAAACGRERGLQVLQEACADPRYASQAVRYLDELGASERIPVHTRSPDFIATAMMCEWLAHPQEFGRAPEKIEQTDTRELFWPPTDDRRKLRLFRYEYAPRGEATEPDVGFGLVGSVTFALFGEATADKSAEEVYALHCAWELQMNDDPRAPKERTAEAGLRILSEYNPGFCRSS